jgi:hypothetical protein
VISFQYPQGWASQETNYGYSVTSPDRLFIYSSEFIPSGDLYGLYSTTDINQIAYDIASKDKSQGRFQLLDTSNQDRVVTVKYAINGIVKLIALSKSNYGIFLTQYIGDARAFNQYYNVALGINKTVKVDATQTPEGQALLGQMGQTASNTIDMGINQGIGRTAQSFAEQNQQAMDYCSKKLGYQTTQMYC